MNVQKAILAVTASGIFAVIPVVDQESVREPLPDDQVPAETVRKASAPWMGPYNTSESRAHDGWCPVDVNINEAADAIYAFDPHDRSTHSSADLIMTSYSG